MSAYRAETAPTEDRILTIQEFLEMPEPDGCQTELVRGRVVREPIASYGHSSTALQLGAALLRYAREHGLGHVTGADGGYILSEEAPTVRVPDAAFISHERIPLEDIEGFYPGAPDLAVEVISPSNMASEMQAKIFEYFEAGTRLVWVVYPETHTVAVHRSREEIHLLREGDELDGGDVVPGFRLAVAEVFGG